MLTKLWRKKAEMLKILQKVRIVANFKSKRRKENKAESKTNRERKDS
jgi:hypothetical protein